MLDFPKLIITGLLLVVAQYAFVPPASAQCGPGGDVGAQASLESGSFYNLVGRSVGNDSKSALIRRVAEKMKSGDVRGAMWDTAFELRERAHQRLRAQYGSCPAGQSMRGISNVRFSNAEIRDILLTKLRRRQTVRQ